MKSILFEQFGGAEVIHLGKRERPTIGDHELLIDVVCAGVNPVDWKVREGFLAERAPHHFPITPGWDVSGRVVEIGAKVKDFAKGDPVMAYCRKPSISEGSFGQAIAFYAIHTLPKPAQLSFAQAAALPLVSLTAWQALFDVANLQKGQTVFIPAGAGGVGSLAIQLAKWRGARVVTSGSAKNHLYLLELGAEKAIDYHQEAVVDSILQWAPDGVDVTLETLGETGIETALRCTRPGGFIVTIAAPISPEQAASAQVYTSSMLVRPDRQELGQIVQLIIDGKIQVPPVEELSLERAGEALERIRMGHVRGKLVLRIAPEEGC